MSLVLSDLPRDPDRLLQHLQQMNEVVTRQNASLVSLQAKYDTVLTEQDTLRAERDAAQAEIEKLRLLIRRLQRGQFGRRSEKLDPDQLQLGLEDLEQTAAAAEAAQEEAAARNSTPRPPRVRRRNLGSLPVHLPRVEVLVDVGDKSCPCCGGALHVIGEDTSEMLDHARWYPSRGRWVARKSRCRRSPHRKRWKASIVASASGNRYILVASARDTAIVPFRMRWWIQAGSTARRSANWGTVNHPRTVRPRGRPSGHRRTPARNRSFLTVLTSTTSRSGERNPSRVRVSAISASPRPVRASSTARARMAPIPDRALKACALVSTVNVASSPPRQTMRAATRSGAVRSSTTSSTMQRSNALRWAWPSRGSRHRSGRRPAMAAKAARISVVGGAGGGS